MTVITSNVVSTVPVFNFELPKTSPWLHTVKHFHWILIAQFQNVQISLHFYLAFCQHFTTIYKANGWHTKFLRVFNYDIYPTCEIRKNVYFTVCSTEFRSVFIQVQVVSS